MGMSVVVSSIVPERRGREQDSVRIRVEIRLVDRVAEAPAPGVVQVRDSDVLCRRARGQRQQRAGVRSRPVPIRLLISAPLVASRKGRAHLTRRPYTRCARRGPLPARLERMDDLYREQHPRDTTRSGPRTSAGRSEFDLEFEDVNPFCGLTSTRLHPARRRRSRRRGRLRGQGLRDLHGGHLDADRRSSRQEPRGAASPAEGVRPRPAGDRDLRDADQVRSVRLQGGQVGRAGTPRTGRRRASRATRPRRSHLGAHGGLRVLGRIRRPRRRAYGWRSAPSSAPGLELGKPDRVEALQAVSDVQVPPSSARPRRPRARGPGSWRGRSPRTAPGRPPASAGRHFEVDHAGRLVAVEGEVVAAGRQRRVVGVPGTQAGWVERDGGGLVRSSPPRMRDHRRRPGQGDADARREQQADAKASLGRAQRTAMVFDFVLTQAYSVPPTTPSRASRRRSTYRVGLPLLITQTRPARRSCPCRAVCGARRTCLR